MSVIRFIPAFGFLLAAQFAAAQSYKTAAGIRVGQGLNITVQQHIADGWTAEGILHTSTGSDKFGVTLLAEKHQKIIFRGINLYGGGGMHYYRLDASSRSETETANPNVYGLSLIGGAELSLGRINLAFDWKPELHLSESAHPFEWNGAAVSVRYIFAKRERKKIRDWKIFH